MGKFGFFRNGDDAPDQKRGTKRPKIGIALGSGVARGWAHLGVLQRLLELDYEPDIVAGTSMGALIGGCYAAGNLHQLEAFALGLTRRKVFGLLDLTLSGSGLIAGTKLTTLLNKHLGHLKIESLDRQFIGIATELATGHEIWLRQGPLVEAMQASYALPGIFKPVKIDGIWLMDGALVNPIPVSVCRAMGARLVIAVNLNTDAFGAGTVIQSTGFNGDTSTQEPVNGQSRSLAATLKRRFFGVNDNPDPGISDVMMAAFNVVQDRLARSRLAGDPPDVMIAPRASHIGIFDFDKAKESIELGRDAVDKALPFLEEAVEVLKEQA
jgi:NTE family protein